MRGQLRESLYGVLSGAGAATVKLGPLTAREKWYPTNISVNANANPTNEAQCNIYIGDANTKRLMDSTVNGSSGDSTGKTAPVRSGEFVWAEWTGGDAGQRCTLTVVGEKEV